MNGPKTLQLRKLHPFPELSGHRLVDQTSPQFISNSFVSP